MGIRSSFSRGVADGRGPRRKSDGSAPAAGIVLALIVIFVVVTLFIVGCGAVYECDDDFTSGTATTGVSVLADDDDCYGGDDD